MSKEYRITIELDGKPVPLLINPNATKIYRKYFRRDIMATFEKYTTNYDNSLFTNEKIAQVIWAFARNANPTIPKYKYWIDQYNSIPIADLYVQILEEVNKQ